nr:hypothetical protein Iba_chr06bCG16790 [Ipomoea batatas]
MLFLSFKGDRNTRSVLLAPTVIIQGAALATVENFGPLFVALHATTMLRLLHCRGDAYFNKDVVPAAYEIAAEDEVATVDEAANQLLSATTVATAYKAAAKDEAVAPADSDLQDIEGFAPTMEVVVYFNEANETASQIHPPLADKPKQTPNKIYIDNVFGNLKENVEASLLTASTAATDFVPTEKVMTYFNEVVAGGETTAAAEDGAVVVCG